MIDRVIREGSKEPIAFDLEYGTPPEPYDVRNKFFVFVLADKHGRAQRWDNIRDRHLFALAPEEKNNRILFYPPKDAFKYKLRPYQCYFWVYETATQPLSFPSERNFEIDVLDSFNVIPDETLPGVPS